MNRRLRQRLRRRLQHDQRGFTLIELTVAIFITLLMVTVLAGAFLSSIGGVALAKQRQQGTALATATMEQFRSIDYATIQGGMTCSDVSGDLRVTLSGACGAGTTGTFAPGIGGISEPLVLQTTGASVAPLLPHQKNQTVENVVYGIGAFVSRPTVTSQAFNFTVIVTWRSSVSKGTKTVIQRSVGFSPSRCLSSATHPFAGACQSSFNGDAGLTKGGISIVNATDGVSPITGLSGTMLDLGFNALSTTVNAEQITTLTGLTSTSRVDAVTGATTSAGGVSTSVSADNDPASVSTGVGTANLSQPGVSTLTLTGSGGTLSGVPTTSDVAQLDARSVSGAGTCFDSSGSAINVLNQPCSWGTTQRQGSTGTISLSLPGGAPNFTLASVAASTAAARGVVARVGASGGTACPTTSGVGCLTAQASRSLGAITVGGLPVPRSGDTPPTGWGGSLITVSGLQESAYAEAGPGHRNPSFTRSAGTLTYYDVVTRTVKTLTNFTSLAADFAADLGTTVGTYAWGAHTTVISLTGSMRVGSVTPLAPSVSIPDAACKTSACSYSATTASALTATLVYSVTIDGAADTTFAMTVDLGALLTRAAYKAAFDA